MLLKVILSVVVILGLTSIPYAIYWLVTLKRHRELERTYEQEYERWKLRENKAPSFLRNNLAEPEKKMGARKFTESGRRLNELDETGKWIMLTGLLVAVVLVGIYWKFDIVLF